jgi:hypothetical protein
MLVVKPAGFRLANIRCSSYSGDFATTSPSPTRPRAGLGGGVGVLPADSAFSTTVTGVDAADQAVPASPPNRCRRRDLTPTLLWPAGAPQAPEPARRLRQLQRRLSHRQPASPTARWHHQADAEPDQRQLPRQQWRRRGTLARRPLHSAPLRHWSRRAQAAMPANPFTATVTARRGRPGGWPITVAPPASPEP